MAHRAGTPGLTADSIRRGEAALGIELGSTRIKACLVGPDHIPVAESSYEWQNRFVDRIWTYPLDEVWTGVRATMAQLVADVGAEYGTSPTRLAALGVSAMMHGYLAFDAEDNLLVPFRTWRNTTTEKAAKDLTEALGFNIPLRWSAAHLYQAVLDEEPHLGRLAFVTTLAGYVHWRLSGHKVLGVGDASGMFPIDPLTRDYDAGMLRRFDRMLRARRPGLSVADLLPRVLVAGQDAGHLSPEGAALLDPTATVRPGTPMCPPEGDAGTGMVATNSVLAGSGNVSVGTSIFAMIVLEKPLSAVHNDLDVVATPAGSPVAMVHCNNGASELEAWARVFAEFAGALGLPRSDDLIFRTIFETAIKAEPDGGGLVAYNFVAGEPIVGLSEGRPLVARSPGSRLSLGNFVRAQIYAAFATLSLGMQTLAGEGVEVASIFAHGGIFRTAGVAQRLLAAALGVPVGVGATASEGGAWGMALLASYMRFAGDQDLASFLQGRVFSGADVSVVAPDDGDVAGFNAYLDRYRRGLPIERLASELLA